MVDKDLLSIQEARSLVRAARAAQAEFSQLGQERIDAVVKAVSEATAAQAEALAVMANEETGYGKPQDKKIKNLLASEKVYACIKDMKTVGILREDKVNKIVEIAVPVGVIAGIIPSTNPTSTVIYKSLISLKAGNAIVFTPHPAAKKCIGRTVQINNMNTFYSLWGTKTPEEAKLKIEEQIKAANISNPKNLEEQAISLVGKDIYEILIKGYTEKQWGRKATDVPAFIIKRIPVRFTFDNNYFNDKYQGIPIGGYTNFIKKLLSGAEVRCNIDYIQNKAELVGYADKIVYTGPIDEYFNYCFGELEYRSLRFEEEILDIPNFQGNAVVNYTEAEVPYTRIIEHKHFEFGTQEKTVISKEYSLDWKEGAEPYYPINDEKNNRLYQKYKVLSEKEKNVLFGGRLAEYKYYDMHQIVEKVLNINEF